MMKPVKMPNNIIQKTTFKDSGAEVNIPLTYTSYIAAVRDLVEDKEYSMEETRMPRGVYTMTLYKDFSDDDTIPIKTLMVQFNSDEIGDEEYGNIHNYMIERVYLKYAQKMSGAAAETGVSYEDWLYVHNDVTSIPDLSNPDWNQSAGGHTWDMVRKIANGNDAYTKDDVIFLTYMMKHIVRAGAKPYEGKTDHESKVIDLRKAYRYLEAWLDIMKDAI